MDPMTPMNSTLSTLAIALVPLATTHAGTSSVPDASEPGGQTTPAVTAATATVTPAAADDEITFKAYWKNGLTFKSSDGATKIQLGGRIYNDWAWFSADPSLTADVGPHENGTEMRSARIYIKGTIDDRYFFKANYDFGSTKLGDGGPGFKDVYMGLKGLPIIKNIQVGHFKEPIGLDVLTSSKYITFLERSLTGGAEPSRNTGLMAFGATSGERMTYAVGAFRDSNKFGAGNGDGSYAFTGRLTALPLTNEDHTKMLHIGLAASHRTVESVRFKYRPESHLAPVYIDTGDLAADAENLVGLEWATVTGPFYTQAEYVYIDVSGTGSAPSPAFSSFYGQVSWFVTGESKVYSAKNATFGRVEPKRPWGKGGPGAWELALRYSDININDPGINGGELEGLTGGVNWYLSSFSRVMVNYLRTDKMDVGSSETLMVRFQIDF